MQEIGSTSYITNKYVFISIYFPTIDEDSQTIFTEIKKKIYIIKNLKCKY